MNPGFTCGNKCQIQGMDILIEKLNRKLNVPIFN